MFLIYIKSDSCFFASTHSIYNDKCLFLRENAKQKNIMNRKFIFILFLFLISVFQAQEYYSELRKKYWEYEENDGRAFIYLNMYIASAKKEKNYAELFQGYDDAKRYSINDKLKYADSAIVAAKKSENRNLIGNAHIGKGTVYYFNYRKFQPALDEYLKAYEYLKSSDDKFLKYQNLYHIGVVKSYLGYYKEALEIFKECIIYFEPNAKADIHPNLIFNNKKGYINCLHQMIVCHQHLNNFKESERLIQKGLNEIPKNNPYFELEKSYFYKCKGILEFNKKSYKNVINDFDTALPELIKINDFTWASVVYFYRGLSYSKMGDKQKALLDYKKVDSIFVKHQFILPELRQNYEELIKYYKKKDNPKQELYYTNQLLKADSIISSDFKSLSIRIHKEYDTKALLEAKKDLESSNFLSKSMLMISGIIILLLGIIFFYWFKRKKELQKKYDELLLKINSDFTEKPITPIVEIALEKNSKLDTRTFESLQKAFDEFEKNKGFLEKGITAGKLAIQMGTNATYISQFMSEYKESNFNTYINKLRIDYATQKIYNDKQWRKYSVEDIALSCGFSNRQSFSNVFYKQNGIRPADFLKKRNQELELQKNS